MNVRNGGGRGFRNNDVAGARVVVFGVVVGVMAGCSPSPGPGPSNTNSSSNDNGVVNVNDNTPVNGNDNQPGVGGVVWGPMFDGNFTGALVSIWGSGADDVFAVGGQLDQGEVYHFNGQQWQAMDVPSVPILAWVYGFASNDVYAVGEGGGVIHYNGATWSTLSPGTSEDLWCVWGSAPNDIWMVGGESGDSAPPVIRHYNGVSFTNVAPPANDRNATALYSVWGVDDRVWAVGSMGLIIERVPSTGVWAQVPVTGQADQDFLSIWGTSEDHVVAVGGSTSGGGRIARYDGTSWSVAVPAGVGMLNVFYAFEEDEGLIGGPDGFVAMYDSVTGDLTPEDAGAFQSIRGIWSEGVPGKYWVVGALFSPVIGAGYLRTDDGVERVGEQPDVNEDGSPDAPLTEDGERPDDVTSPNGNENSNSSGNINDNIAPTEPALVAGIEDENAVFSPLVEGGELTFSYVPQPPGNQSQLTFQVFGFPDSALNQIGSFEYSVTDAVDGTVLGSQITVGLFQSSGTPGVFLVRRSLSYGNYGAEELQGRTVNLSVTITFDGATPAVSADFEGTFSLTEVEF